MIPGFEVVASSPVMHPLSPEAMGIPFQSSTAGGLSSGITSAAWPAANRALFYPITLRDIVTVARMWCYNGSIVSGNVDLGIYDNNLNLLVSAGSTAQSGTSALQYIDVTDTTIGPGQYWLAMAVSNTTATVQRMTGGNSTGWIYVTAGLREMASALPLPSTVTFNTAISTAYVPVFGYTQRTF